jgi:hypothetical protein
MKILAASNNPRTIKLSALVQALSGKWYYDGDMEYYTYAGGEINQLSLDDFTFEFFFKQKATDNYSHIFSTFTSNLGLVGGNTHPAHRFDYLHFTVNKTKMVLNAQGYDQAYTQLGTATGAGFNYVPADIVSSIVGTNASSGLCTANGLNAPPGYGFPKDWVWEVVNVGTGLTVTNGNSSGYPTFSPGVAISQQGRFQTSYDVRMTCNFYDNVNQTGTPISVTATETITVTVFEAAYREFPLTPSSDLHHVAIVRKDNAVKFYLDGTLLDNCGTIQGTLTFAWLEIYLYSGVEALSSTLMTKLKLSDVAKYEQNFSPPTPSQLSSDADTVAFWSCQDQNSNQVTEEIASRHIPAFADWDPGCTVYYEEFKND